MRQFIIKTIWVIAPLLIVSISGVLMPTTPRASKSLLMASIYKDSLLQSTMSPRIIFVGGSNISFGLNSEMIEDSLNICTINTGIHAGIGLKYMMDNTLQYVEKGDIVVLIPEYIHFYKDYYCGSEELFRTVFDVNSSKSSLLNIYQILNIVSLLPKYALSKLKLTEYLNVKESDIYSVNSFNRYGDAHAHWGKARQEFRPSGKINTQYNPEVISKIKEFQSAIYKKGAFLLISYPGFQDISYRNNISEINKVEQEIKIEGFKILGTPERYMIPDSMMFNTPYHLNKNGVDYRTNLFIADFKKSANKQQQ